MEAIPLPNQVQLVEQKGNQYTFVMEPLYPGYGDTVGNALRRVLLSSIPGAAVVAVKMKWVDHEFSTIPNIKEDVVQIILNLKQLRLRVHSSEPVRLSLKVKGERSATAADIKATDLVEVINPDLHIATLGNKAAELDMELIVQQGRGYVPVEQREHEKHEVGMIAVDAIYSPVKNANFSVTNVRVGQLTNYNRLTVTLETDGTIDGRDALNIASHILVDHFKMFVTDAPVATPDFSDGVMGAVGDEGDAAASGEASVKSLNLSVRAQNALEKNGITTVEQLNALSADEIAALEGLGEKTRAEVLAATGKVQE
jgi:DNA-directed RNA polymerase subunit alpha